MKVSSSGNLMALAFTLLLAASAFAGGDTHKASMQVLGPVQINGKQLAAGEYQLRWQGDGPNVELNITKNNQVLATVPARVVELESKTANGAVVLNTNQDGSRSVSEIRPAGKKFSFAVGNESMESKSAQASK